MTNTQIDVETFRAEARAWIQENLERRPNSLRSGRIEREATTPEQIAESRSLQRKLFDGGFAGISYPAEYGGRGLTSLHERAFREEAIDYLTPNFGAAGSVTFGAIGRSLVAHCTPEFLEQHIPKILSGEELWCQFYSEPEAGSDLAGIRTRAVRDGDRWIISGSKIWSSGAYLSDWAMCLARTDWDSPKHRGLTWFALPTRSEGVTLRQIEQINGNAEFCEEFLDEVEVSDDDIIGEVNQGWSVTQTMLVYERGAGEMGATTLEPRELAPDLVDLARRVNRTTDPAARQAIAKAHINDFAQYHLGHRIADRLRSSASPEPHVAAYGKLASGVFAPIRARLAMEIGGPAALTWASGDEDEGQPALNYLNGRVTSIAAGTNEMQRNGIGERVLGLPREPSFDTNKPFSDVLKSARNWDSKVG
ncbi:MAG: acyl-CoA dehydrogenase [Actinomycetia bacterium]|nr:acyl-CoA dehydrogenase [Actinomycetes bacterium]MCP5034286.1 acyl-CoA dehydrogenase [Actinomycetes bacterium]